MIIDDFPNLREHLTRFLQVRLDPTNLNLPEPGLRFIHDYQRKLGTKQAPDKNDRAIVFTSEGGDHMIPFAYKRAGKYPGEQHLTVTNLEFDLKWLSDSLMPNEGDVGDLVMKLMLASYQKS